jgi:hypothetical protein
MEMGPTFGKAAYARWWWWWHRDAPFPSFMKGHMHKVQLEHFAIWHNMAQQR